MMKPYLNYRRSNLVVPKYNKKTKEKATDYRLQVQIADYRFSAKLNKKAHIFTKSLLGLFSYLRQKD